MQQTPDKDTLKPKRNFKKKFFRVLIVLFVLFIILNLALVLVLKNKKVQNYLVDRITQSISEEIGQDFQIDEVNLTSLMQPYVEGIYIEDNKSDTLFSCDRIYLGVSSSYFELIKGEIKVNSLEVTNPYFRITRDRNRISNFDYSVNKEENLKKVKNDNAPNGFLKKLELNVDNIYIKDLRGVYSDTVNSSRFDINMNLGTLTSDNWDLACNEFYFESINLDKLEVINTKFFDLIPMDIKPVEEPLSHFFKKEKEVKPELYINSRALKLTNSKFHLHKRRSEPIVVEKGAINFDHMQLNNINLHTNDINFLNEITTANDLTISLEETTGFKVSKMYAKKTTISKKFMDFLDLEIKSDYSHVFGDFNMKYKDFGEFSDFNNNIYMRGELTNSKVAIEDLFYFARPLHSNSFFLKNKNLITNLSGKFKGKVNSLKTEDISLSLGDKLKLRGDFRSRDITNRDELSLDMEVRELNTDISTVGRIIPNFNLPTNFKKIGNINFKGRFIGFLNDFVSSGILKSDIGNADLDIRFHAKDNKFDNYEGGLKVTNFDLKKWSDNDQFGMLNFVAQVKNGTGFSLDAVNAEIDGKIQSLDFRDYNYQNASITGTINKNLFNGSFNIKDKNANLTFVGNINNQNEIPKFKFNSTIYNLDLQKLNLYNKELKLLGTIDMDLEHIDPDKAIGYVNITDIILHSKDTTIIIDSMRFLSQRNNTKRVMKLESDIANLSVVGEYSPKAVLNEIKKYFKRNQNYLYERLYDGQIDTISGYSNYNYKFIFGDINPLLGVLGYDNYKISKGEVRGDFNSSKEEYKVSVDFPFLQIDSTSIFNILSVSSGIGDKIQLSIELDSFEVNGNMIPKTELVGKFIGDSLSMDLKSKDLIKQKDYIDISLNSLPLGNDQFEIKIKDSLYVLGDLWNIDKSNRIFLSQDSISIDHLNFKYDSLIVLNLNDINKGKGLNLDIDGLKMHLIDRFWDYDKLDFEGEGDLSLSLSNIFKREDLKLDVLIPNFQINDDDWGNLKLTATSKNLKSIVNTSLSIKKDTQELKLVGKYLSPLMLNKPNDLNFENALDQNLSLKNIPLDILEYFIVNGITNTEGELNGNIDFRGDLKSLDVDGFGIVSNGATKVDYLNTRYFFDNDTVLINNFNVDASGATIQDELGNIAIIYGGLTHNHLKNFELSISASSREFLILNTNKTLNPLYYGKVVGDLTAEFYGPFNKTDIVISGTTGKNTVLNIPINYDSDGSELDYIVFVNPKNTVKESFNFEESGISVVLDLKITEDAKGRIIFNEDSGDVIEGYGNGDIKLDILRNEPFVMQGEYTFSRGNYLFSLKDFIKKPFIVKEGSSISWDGDPLAGKMNIEALYLLESAKVYNLIAENLSSPELKEQASIKTPVHLKLFLKDELLKPTIDFDIEIPEVPNSLTNLVDTKLSSIRSNKAELNRQVLGLIVANSFLPNNLSSSRTSVVDYSLTTDFVTNELSNLVSDLLVKAIEDIDFISNIDFNLGYTSSSSSGSIVNPYNTFDVNLPIYFYDDRISVTVGSSIGITDQVSHSNYFNGDIEIEYAITKDRRIKVRVLTKKFNDYLQAGNNIKYGAGLRYFREFDNLSELFNSK